MSSGTTGGQDKRALYWLGERLIDYRHPVMIVVLIITGYFAYLSSQLKLETSFGDLLPQSHPFVQIHNKYAPTFGGANNIQLMVEVRDGDIFTVPTLARIYRITEEMDPVYRGTAAADAGIKVGDTIVSVNGKPVGNRAELAAAIKPFKPGTELSLGVQRGEAVETAKLMVPERDMDIFVAGEPRLYGWVYSYASDVFWILTVTYCLEWLLRWMYFHDWRGALRPTLTGLIAAFWGLGFVHIIGFALDPLILVMPFLITARAVSHAIQMHDRYYEEFERHDWNQRKAIVAAFAELFIPTFAGVVTDALGVLVIILVPIVMLRNLAIVISWWILAITVAELLLNPVVYYYLRAPDPEVVLARDKGWYKALINRVTDWNLSSLGKATTMVFWLGLTVVGAYLMRGLIVGDPTSASPLVWSDSPYNVSHAHIQDKFGGVEPLIVVAEGKDRDAMKDPKVLRTMENFQRYLERDRDVGYSFSLTDILRAVNMVFHELEPKWGVIPNNSRDVAQTFFIFFSGSPPTETAKYVDPSYTTSHVTFFARNHKGDNIARIIQECKNFIARPENNMDGKATFKLAGGLIGVLAAANEELVRNDLLMNFLGFFTIYVIVLFSYRSWMAGLYLLMPLFISNILINAAMAVFEIGINVNTLPLVTVGVGFGIDYGLYILSL